MKKLFVTGVTGAQGSGIAKVLKKNGFSISSVSPNNADTQNELGTIYLGNLEALESLKLAMAGCEAIVLTLPLIFDTEIIKKMTSNVIDAAKFHGINKIIFNAGIALGENKTGSLAIDVKHEAFEILSKSGLEVITLMPNVYLENLTSPFLLPVIQEHSIIPYPISGDFKFSWLSYENLGRYVVAALNSKGLAGEKILITNREELIGQALAEKISSASGKKLPFIPTPPDDFENNLKPVLGDYVAKEISNLYRGIDSSRSNFVKYSHLEFLDSVELQSTDDWVKSINW